MHTWVALLRGINVGGHRKIPMAELRELFGELGMAGAVTYLQSGNVVFDSELAEASSLAALLEQALEEKFGFSVHTIVRSGDDILKTFESNPFLEGKEVDPKKLLVVFLQDEAPAQGVQRAMAIETGNDELVVAGTEAFLHCPDGYARTKLSTNVLERKLGKVATARNWKTVTALAEILRSRLIDPGPSEAV